MELKDIIHTLKNDLKKFVNENTVSKRSYGSIALQMNESSSILKRIARSKNDPGENINIFKISKVVSVVSSEKNKKILLEELAKIHIKKIPDVFKPYISKHINSKS